MTTHPLHSAAHSSPLAASGLWVLGSVGSLLLAMLVVAWLAVALLVQLPEAGGAGQPVPAPSAQPAPRPFSR